MEKSRRIRSEGGLNEHLGGTKRRQVHFAYAYAYDLLSSNFPESLAWADPMIVRTFVNQIGQIPSPLADGNGYTLLRSSGIEAFSERNRLKIVICHIEGGKSFGQSPDAVPSLPLGCVQLRRSPKR